MKVDKELKNLIERLKRYARSKGARQDEVDDFSQEAAFAIFRGRKATFRQLYVDYLRKTYGDTRSPCNIAKSRSTLQYEVLDENMFGGDPGNGLSDRETAGCFEKIYDALSFNEYIAINSAADFSGSRRSQLRKAAKAKINECLKYQHAYYLMETDELWINYIVI